LSPIHDSETTSRLSHDDSTATANTTPRSTGRSSPPRSPGSNSSGSNTARSITVSTTATVQQTVTSLAINGGTSPRSLRDSSAATSPRAVKVATIAAKVAGVGDGAADDASVFDLPAMTVQVKKELPTTASVTATATASGTGSFRSRQRNTPGAQSPSSRPTSPAAVGKTTLMKSVQKVMATTKFNPSAGGRALSLAGLVQYLVSDLFVCVHTRSIAVV
jgi:hypothetical protein